MDNIWAIIPAYNEKNVQSVIDQTKKSIDNIVVIDDGSDNKIEVRDAYLIRHPINMGKGSALKTGCEFAIRKGADTFVFIDSDGQHNPEDIPRFLYALVDKDIIFSYRQEPKTMPLILRIGNIGLTFIVKIFFGIKLKDVQCGYRAMTLETYKKIKWESAGYEVENEIIARAGKHKLRYAEIPIQTLYHDKYKGTTLLDGLRIGWKMLIWRLQNRKL